MSDFVILANTRWNRDGEGRGGNSSAQYTDAIMRRGWRVSYFQKDGKNSLTPLNEIVLGPDTVVMCDVPWIDYYYETFMKLKAQGCRSVYRIVDNWLLTPRRAEYSIDREIEFIKTADVVCASNPLSIERFREVRPDISLLRNGIDLGYFWNWQGKPPADLRRGNPTAVFVTSLWDPTWIDWESILEAAKSLPELSFNIIGDPARVTIAETPLNLHFIGRRPWSSLPAYLHHSDVGIVPYNSERTRYNNPIKVLEYLACGLPVVAAPNQSVQDYPYLYFYQGKEKFSQLIEKAVQSCIDREKLYQNLKQHTWDVRLDMLLAKVFPPSQESSPK